MARQGIGTGSSPNDGSGDNLRAGAAKINDNFSEIYTYFGDGTNLSFSGGVWNTVSAGINTLSSVGIGTTNPRFTLEVGAVGTSGTSLYVNGDARVTGILTVGSSSISLNGSTNEITVGTGITISGNTGIISATQVNIGGETLTGAGVTSLVAGSNITLSGSTGQVTINSSGGGGGSGITTANINADTLNVSGISTLGITSVTGHTLHTKQLNVSGVSTFFGDIKLGDGSGGTPRINIGDGAGVHPQDAEIYHSSSHGTVFQDDTSTGIQIWTGGVGGIKGQNGTNFIIRTDGSAQTAELYSGGNKKLETNSDGVTITGICSASGGVQVGAGESFGANGPTAVYYGDGSNLTGVSGSGGVTVQDEGSALSTVATTLNFVGSGVVASGTGATKTITVSGGGDITAVTAGTGLSGGGTTGDVTLNLANTAVSAGSYTNTSITVDAQGRLTAASSGNAYGSRTTANAATGSIADAAAADITITAAKTYVLHKIQTSAAAWVTLYADSSSRSSDSSRTETTDPLPGSGVVAEVIHASGTTSLITPGTIGFNNDGTPSTNVYAKVVNKSGSTQAITVTLTYLPLE